VLGVCGVLGEVVSFAGLEVETRLGSFLVEARRRVGGGECECTNALSGFAVFGAVEALSLLEFGGQVLLGGN
jgi:hypothetical protein